MNEINPYLSLFSNIENEKKSFIKANLSNTLIEALSNEILAGRYTPSLKAKHKLIRSINHRLASDNQKTEHDRNLSGLNTEKLQKLFQLLEITAEDEEIVLKKWQLIENEEAPSLIHKISDQLIDELIEEILSQSFSFRFEIVDKFLHCLAYCPDVNANKIAKLLRVLDRGDFLEQGMYEWLLTDSDIESMSDLMDLQDAQYVLSSKTKNENLIKLAFHAVQRNHESLALELIKCLDKRKAIDLQCFEERYLSQNFLSQMKEILHEDPLITACRKLSIHDVATLLHAGKDPNTVDARGISAIFYALQSSQGFENDCKEIVELFLANPSFNKFCRDSEKRGLLFSAFQFNNELVVDLLLKHRLLADQVTADFKFPQDFCPNIFEFSQEFKLRFIPLLNIVYEGPKTPEAEAFLNFICLAWLFPAQIYEQKLSFSSCVKLLDCLMENEEFFGSFPNFAALLLSYAIKSDLLLTQQIINFLQRAPFFTLGPAGKRLLHVAISVGNFPVVKQLVDLRVNFKESYKSSVSLSNGAEADWTPLHHAVLSNQCEIAEYLVSHGVPIDVLGENQLSPLVCILNKTNFLEEYSEIVSWLVDQGADLEQTNSSNQTLLSIAVEQKNKNWPLIFQLVEKEAFLATRERTELLHAAIKASQYSLVEKLFEQAEQNLHGTSVDNLVKSLNFETLYSLLNNPVSFWVCDKISYFVEAGLDLNSLTDSEGKTLLTKPISNEMIPFLITQGMDLDHANNSGITPRYLLETNGLVQSVILRAEQIAQKNEVEWALIRQFNLKNLGHLLGSQFLKDMKTSEDQDLEGNYVRASFEFIKQILNYVLEYRYEHFTSQTIERINTFIRQLEFSLDVIFRMDSCFVLKDDTQLAIAITQIAKLIWLSLTNLELYESFFIPAGWNGHSGHLLMMEFVKLDQGIQILLHNTGAGTEFHEFMFKDGKKYINTIKAYFIPYNLLNLNFIKAILEPELLGTTYRTHADRVYSERDLINLLSKYEIKDKTNLPKRFAKVEISGVCSMSGLMALLMSRLEGNEGITLKRMMKKIVTKLSLSDFSHRIRGDRITAKIFSESLCEIGQKFYKTIKGVPQSFLDIETKKRNLENIKKLFDRAGQAFYPRRSQNPSPYDLRITTSETSKVKEWIQEAEQSSLVDKTEKLLEIPEAPPHSLPSLERIKSSKDLLEVFKVYHENTQKNKQNTNLATYLEWFLVHVSKNLILEYNSKSNLIADLICNPKDCLEILKLLNDLNKWTYQKSKTNGKQGIVALFSLASGWILANLMERQANLASEQRMNHYGLNLGIFFDQFLKPDSQKIFSPQQQEDFLILYEFLKQFEPKDSTQALFNFKNGLKKDNNFHLIFESGDWIYTAIHSKDCDWNQIDKKYYDKRNNFSSSIYENYLGEWRMLWCYLKEGLPPYFYLVQNLALHAFACHTKIEKIETNLAELTSPDLVTVPDDENKLMVVSKLKYSQHEEDKIEVKGFEVPRFLSIEKAQRINVQGNDYFGLEPVIHNDVIRKPFVQNEINSTSIFKQFPGFLIRSPHYYGEAGRAVNLAMVIDHFNENLLDLYSTENFLILIFSLNGFLNLRTSFLENRELAPELISFLDRAVEYLNEQKIKDKVFEEKKYLLIHQKIRALQQIRICGLNDVEGEIIELRNYVKGLLPFDFANFNEQKKFRSRLYHYFHLSLILLDSYRGQRYLSENDLYQIILIKNQISIIERINKNVQDEFVFSAFYYETVNLSLELQDQIRNYLAGHPDETNELLNQYIKNLGYVDVNLEWKESAFPIFESRHEDHIFCYNVLLGNFYQNNHQSLITQTEVRGDEEFGFFFPNKGVKLINKGSYFEGCDDLGEFKFKFIKKEKALLLKKFKRKIAGSWYKYIDPDHVDLPLQPFFSCHPSQSVFWNREQITFWKNQEKPGEYLCLKNHTHKTFFLLDAEGYFWLPKELGFNRYEWVSLQNEKEENFIKVDERAFLWKPAPVSELEEPYHLLLVCPNLVDCNHNEFIFELKDGYWIWKAAPHLRIAKTQEINGIPFVHQFLILENSLGDKEALIPSYPICERIPIKDNQLYALLPKKNIFLANLALKNACVPEDYELALKYLKLAFCFESYSESEFNDLESILNLPNEKKDFSSSMIAVCLYAYWLIRDNQLRNQTSLVAKKEELETNCFRFLDLYYLNRTSVNPSLRIENNLSEEDLFLFPDFHKRINRTTRKITPKILSKIHEHCSILSYAQLKPEESPPKSPLTFLTRPGESFSNSFYWIFSQLALKNREDFIKVDNLLQAMRYDSFKSNSALRILLEAALIYHSGDFLHNSYERAKDIVKELELIFIKINSGTIDLDRRPDKLNNLIKYYIDNHNFGFANLPRKIITIKKTKTIPEVLEYQKLLFRNHKNFYQDLAEVYSKFFTLIPEPEEEEFEPFIYDTTEDFVKESILDLNQDYFCGTSKNRKKERHLLQQDPHTVLTYLAEDLDAIYNDANKKLENCQQKMLSLAQSFPKNEAEQLKHEAALLARKKKTLEVEDCILLFLQSDFNGFKKATYLSDAEIPELHHCIGEFLLLARKVDHIKKMAQDLLQLRAEVDEEVTSHKVSILIQKIGEGLKAQSLFDSEFDPVAILTVEYGLRLFLRRGQVENLREAISVLGKRSIFFQMIQASGKSLLFNPLLALLLADGEHLSIHIGATSQQGTGLYDMKYRSSNLFKQMENSFTFDDHPKRFTVENLLNIKKMFKRTIREKKYINTTIESLQALRCKYEKTMLELAFNPRAPSDLAEKAEILKKILSILRSKAIFTFDEMHLALAALKEMHMPFGSSTKISHQQAKLVANLLTFAVTAQHEGKPLLNLIENKQSQQTPEQYGIMLEIVSERFLNDPTTLENLKIFVKGPNREELHVLKAYLLSSKEDVPDFISKLADQAVDKLENPDHLFDFDTPRAKQIKAAADYFVLANRMLGGQWLKNQFSRYVNEHYGLPSKSTCLPISIPYLANMQPDEDSQFSDQFVLMINTFITYLVEGLKPMQIRTFLEDLRKKAHSELNNQRELYDDKIENTPIAQQFFRSTGTNLSNWYDTNKKALKKFSQHFKLNNEDTIGLLFNFVIEKILSQVQLYDHQTSCNGQNVAMMPKAFISYSASLDNLNTIPSHTIIKRNIGTNGQTIDLLIRKSMKVWLNDGVDSLFQDVMAKHPEKERIRVITDVACLFRGIPNSKVAIKICDYLNKTESKMKGVLYFEQKTGKLLFVDKKNPLKSIVLSGTSPEVITLETGYRPEERFTYYDQEHCTGSDIEQAVDTIGVATWGENTRLPLVLQGSRRLRQLDNFQSVIAVLDKGSLSKISSSLNIPLESDLQSGPIDIEKLNIKHLILFSHLNETNAQYQDENLLICIQKLQATVQQAVHDLVYSLPLENGIEVFRKTTSLFDKHILVDLYQKYALQSNTLSKEEYLKWICHLLLQPIWGIFHQDHMEPLIQVMQLICEKALKTLKPEYAVSKNVQLSSLLESSPQAVVTQYQQNVVKEKNNQNQVDIENELDLVQMSDIQNRKFYDEIPFGEETLNNPYFMLSVHEPLSSQGKVPEIWNLNDALMMQYGSNDILPFSSDISVTSNFAMTWNHRIDLLGPFRKIPAQWLLVCDVDLEGKRYWRLLLCSIQDAVNFKEQLKTAASDYRKMFLLRASSDIKLLASNIQIDAKRLEEIPEVNSLIAQALLFSGKLPQLNQEKTLTTLNQIIPQEKKKSYQLFFEEKILRDWSHYRNCPLERFFNS